MDNINGLNALTRDHVNNFWDTSTPIHQTKSMVGTYTGPNPARVNNYNIYNIYNIVPTLVDKKYARN